MSFKIWVTQSCLSYILSLSGRMNEFAASGIDADMGNFSTANGMEKHQITFIQSVFTDTNTCLPLGL